MNTKLGYYTVNNNKFYNKLQAILYANPSRANIIWHFNNEIFDKHDWTIEPPGSLSDIYKLRAIQIREEFDYIIVMASGGADSTNVLHSFLDNNIKIDEIIAGAPLSGLKNWKVNNYDTSANNTVSETFLRQLPLMSEISIKYPDIKITIHDYFEDILQMQTDSWIYESAAHWIHFSGCTRHSLDKFTHLKKLAESGKKIAVVYGIDKPIIYRALSGNLYTVVMDPVVNVVTPHFKDKYSNVESVLFYYTPDLPQLMIKQAHELCRWLYKPENSFAKSMVWDKSKSLKFNTSTQRGSNYQRAIIPCIYPVLGTQPNFWQAEKQGLGFRGGFEIDNWILQLYNKEKFVQMVESDLKLLIKNIDMKYIISDNKADGFIRFYHAWKVGHESNFDKSIVNFDKTNVVGEI